MAASRISPDGAAVYRFFELFDLANVPNSARIFELAAGRTHPAHAAAQAVFEEKMLFALLWNRNLHDFWRQELGEGFLQRLQDWRRIPGSSIRRRCRRTPPSPG